MTLLFQLSLGHSLGIYGSYVLFNEAVKRISPAIADAIESTGIINYSINYSVGLLSALNP